MIFLPIYAIIVLGSNEVCSASCGLPPRLTTSLTIDTLGVHGNNIHKTAKEHSPWSRNGYKKPSAAERTKLILFGSIEPWESFVEPFVAHFLSQYRVSALLPDGNLGQIFV